MRGRGNRQAAEDTALNLMHITGVCAWVGEICTVRRNP